LSKANLAGANLREASLTWANLQQANLTGANLVEAKLHGVDLTRALLYDAKAYRADLSEAKLYDADLTGVAFGWANLARANLGGANLSGADLSWANLHRADLTGANLFWAHLVQTNLRYTRFDSATLTGADLRSANLQEATLGQAILTDAKLWETQRAGWSIKGVVCERIYWDEKALSPTEYAAGEFERLYSGQTCIELFYEGGLSTFELSTLPALLYHLSTKHPETNIRLKTVEETGGGAKITISLGEADEQTKEQVEADALEGLQAQLVLRENESLRLQIQKEYAEGVLDKMMKAVFAAATPQIIFNAPVHTAALPSGNAIVELHQTFNDNTDLIQLIDKLLTRNSELTAPQSAEIEAAKAELQKPNPDKSLLARTLGFLKTLPKEAVLKGVGKLGEKAVEADWSNLLNQLGELIHHIH